MGNDNKSDKLDLIHKLIELHDKDSINDLVIMGTAEKTGPFFFAHLADMYDTYGYAVARFNDMIRQQEDAPVLEEEDDDDE